MIGTTISHYRVIEKLGGGGMGVVYKAEDIRLRRPVALKFLPSELTRDPDAKARFIQEAHAASLIDHPHICTIYEIDETEEGQSFICMAFYDGESLKERLSRGPLSLDEAVLIAVQIAEALDRAHQNGIIHRDVKPANVMLARDGGAKLVDFGLAKLVDETALTRAGIAVGTVGYMSPEQARGDTVDARTDVWSLGVVLYEMLAGQRPFRATSPMAAAHAILNDDPPPLRSLRPDVPPALEAIVALCLAKDARKRYGSAAELCAELRRARRSLVPSSTSIPSPSTALYPHLSTRRRTTVAIAAVAAVAGVATLAILLRRSPAPVAHADTRHMAILPFTSAEPRDAALAAGLAVEVSEALAFLEEASHGSVWVLPMSQVKRGGVASPAQAREQYAVGLAIVGEVHRDGAVLAVRLGAVSAGEEKEPTQIRFEESLSNPSVLLTRPALEVAKLAAPSLLPELERRLAKATATVPSALESYLTARGTLVTDDSAEATHNAVGLLEQAVRDDGQYAHAYAALAMARLREHAQGGTASIDAALEAAKRAVALDPGLAEAHRALGEAWAASGDQRRALAAFKRATELRPYDSDAFVQLARQQEQAGLLDEALATFQQAVYVRPSYWPSCNALAMFYLRRGKYEAAVTQLREVVQLAPENFVGYSNLGGLYFFLHRWNDARETLERSAALKPNYGAFSNLGTIAFQEGRFGDAARWFQRALELDDSDYLVWGNLGHAQRIAGDSKQAEASYRRAIGIAERALESSGDDPALMAELAGYYGLVGERERGLRMLDKVTRNAAPDASLLQSIGESYDDLGDRARALQWMRRAVEAGYPLATIEQDPALRDLRADPRFADLRRAAGNVP